jgi:CubicO group peptidase (beta-lactamase class C family)
MLPLYFISDKMGKANRIYFVKNNRSEWMKSKRRVIFLVLGSAVAAVLLLLLISAAIYTPEYMIRVLTNGESKVSDYAFFPDRTIAKSKNPYQYLYKEEDRLNDFSIAYEAKGEAKAAPLLELLEENDTASMIVVHKDVVIYERYLNGYTKDSINTSFSSVKSLVSLLIGMAMEDGHIKSEEQAISDYITEFADSEFDDITIKNLLTMRSNIRYEEGNAWFSDDAKTYYYPNLRRLALEKMRIDPDYGGQFHYNNYHPLLLGIILERSTGMLVADYFQKQIWDPIGAEHDASWSIDSVSSGFEKMESGLNFIPIDYAKIGSMLLHNGIWNGQEVIGTDWLSRSLIAPAPLSSEDLDDGFLPSREVGYQYMWYSIKNAAGGHDYFAAGKYGQYLYISPENEVVIVRTGTDTGEVDWWPDVFRQVAAQAMEWNPTPPAPEIPCPLDGTMLYKMPTRAVAITIDNNGSAQPQTGLTQADIVYEVPVEGGITRFLAVFFHGEADVIGPIRSARPYLIDIAREWDAVYIHAGQSPQAQAYFSRSRIAHINEMFHPSGFWRDKGRSAPHNLYSSTQNLWKEIVELGLDKTAVPEGFSFRLDGEALKGESATELSIPYLYSKVSYRYDETTGTYLRYQFGKPYRDLGSGEQLSAANVILQQVSTRAFDAEGRLEVNLIGDGVAILFSDGHAQQGTWKRDSVTSRTIFRDSDGNEMMLKPGQTWIQMVTRSTNYKFK